MTTCAYDGQHLAADSRSTSGSSSAKAYKCSSCGEHSTRVNDESIKIYGDFGEKLYRKEKIIAMAGAGLSRDIEKAVNVVQKGEDLDEVYRVVQLVQVSRVFDASFLIVTEKSVFHLANNRDSGKVEVKQFGRDAKIAIGSGAAAARFAMKALNMTAMEAVMAASLGDDGTGGDVRWVDCNEPVGKPDKHNLLVRENDDKVTNMLQNLVTSRFGQPPQKPIKVATKRTRRSPFESQPSALAIAKRQKSVSN